jgi:NADH dehydrogenase FAD-containing subunit
MRERAMKRIVILGGGFGGGAAMRRLDRYLRQDAEVEVEIELGETDEAIGALMP